MVFFVNVLKLITRRIEKIRIIIKYHGVVFFNELNIAAVL